MDWVKTIEQYGFTHLPEASIKGLTERFEWKGYNERLLDDQPSRAWNLYLKYNPDINRLVVESDTSDGVLKARLFEGQILDEFDLQDMFRLLNIKTLKECSKVLKNGDSGVKVEFTAREESLLKSVSEVHTDGTTTTYTVNSLKFVDKLSPSKSVPTAYNRGTWDGVRSDLCMVKDVQGKYHLAHYYEFPDGEGEWYDQSDFGLKHEVTEWIEVDKLQDIILSRL